LRLALDPKDPNVIPSEDDYIEIHMHRYMDTDKNMRDLIALFNKSYHDALNEHIKEYPNTSLKHDGFWIHTEYVPPDTDPNAFNSELTGEVGEIECRIVFDTDPSYYPDHNLYAVLLNPNENAKILFGDIFYKEPKVRIVS
jgi:hypothetical protein